MWELETEGRSLLNEKIKEVKKTEAKAREIIEKAFRWREAFYEQLKKEKDKLFSQAREEAKREIDTYSKKVKEEAVKEINLLEREEEAEEKELEKRANQNFEMAVEEALRLFLKTYGG